MGQKKKPNTAESTVINPYDSTKSVDLSLACLFIRQNVQHIFTYYCQRREAGQKKIIIKLEFFDHLPGPITIYYCYGI